MTAEVADWVIRGRLIREALIPKVSYNLAFTAGERKPLLEGSEETSHGMVRMTQGESCHPDPRVPLVPRVAREKCLTLKLITLSLPSRYDEWCCPLEDFLLLLWVIEYLNKTVTVISAFKYFGPKYRNDAFWAHWAEEPGNLLLGYKTQSIPPLCGTWGLSA